MLLLYVPLIVTSSIIRVYSCQFVAKYFFNFFPDEMSLHKICKAVIDDIGLVCVHEGHDLIIRNWLGGTLLPGDHGTQSIAEPAGLPQGTAV